VKCFMTAPKAARVIAVVSGLPEKQPVWQNSERSQALLQSPRLSGLPYGA
jgi:hypothetical protein